MIAAFDTYIKYVPDSPELPNIKYRKARIYYEYNHFDEAIPLFKDIAEHHHDVGAGDLLGQPPVRLLDDQEEVRRAAGARSTSSARCTQEKDATFKAQCATLEVRASTRKRIEIADEGRALQGGGAALHQAGAGLSERSRRSTRSTTTPPCSSSAPSCIGSAIQARAGAAQGQAGLDAGQEGDLSDRPQLPGHRRVRAGGRQLRAVRREVPGREGRADRAQLGVVLPSRSRRERQGDQGRRALRQGLRRSPRVRRQGGRRRLRRGPDLRAAEGLRHGCRSTSRTT